jgi:hypothetical protein
MRRQAPKAGDLINNLTERPCYSLHSGHYSAATWYDAQLYVVWLLAAGMHSSGDRNDFYAMAPAASKRNICVRRRRIMRISPTIRIATASWRKPWRYSECRPMVG